MPGVWGLSSLGDAERADPRSERQQVRGHVRLQRVHHVHPRSSNQVRHCLIHLFDVSPFFDVLSCHILRIILSVEVLSHHLKPYPIISRTILSILLYRVGHRVLFRSACSVLFRS